MKNFKLNRTPIDIGVKKKHLFIKKLLVLLVVLITCIPQMWAQNVHVKKSSHIYFEPLAPDGTTWNWSSYSYIYFVSGDANGWKMDAISNTLLRHCTATNEDWTHDNTGVRLFAAKSDWGAKNYSMGGWDNMSKDDNCNNITDWWNNGGTWYTFDSDKSYIISLNKTGSKSDLSTITATWNSDDYSGMNKSQTLKAKISTDNGSSYSEANTPGALSAATKTFSDWTTCNTTTNGSLSAGSSSSNFNSGYTAQITLTAATSVTGYTFMGWYAGSSSLSTSNGVATYRARAATTYYAHYKAIQSTLSFDHEGGSGGPSNQTVTYGVAPSNITGSNFPTKSGFGFDGYWTEDDGKGIQVINENGAFKSNVENYTDASGKWIRTENTKLYARWMPVGYYVTGGFNNWVGDPSYHKLSGSPLTVGIGLLKKDFGEELSTEFKIRKVNEGSYSGSSNIWYGKNTTKFGKTPSTTGAVKTATGLTGSESNMTLEVWYNGTYTFTVTENPSDIDLEVLVPVVNQLQIYSNGCNDTKDQYYNWGDPVGDVVSKTLTLSRCDYYFKPVWDSEYYGKGQKDKGHTTITRGSNDTNLGVGTGSSNEENLKITPDLKGDYTFSFDTEGKTLSVTFPDRVQVTYGIYTSGGGTGTAGSLTATNDDDSNVDISDLSNYVVDGNTITLTAPSAKEGYTWRGWYTTNSPDPSSWSTNRISEETSINPTVTSSYKTFYAVYSENDYMVTVGASATGGSIVTPAGGSVTAHAATTAAIRADSSNVAWHFNGWTTESAKVGFGNAKASSTTVTTTENATITANFVPRYALNGSLVSDDSPGHGMPGWVFANAADFEVKSVSAAADSKIPVNLQCTCTLDPNTTYKFRILDRSINNRRGCNSSSEPGNILPAEDGDGKYKNWTLNDTEGSGAQDVHLQTVGYGTYIFHITHLTDDANNYPGIQVERQSSKLLTLGSKTTYIGDEDSETATEGGTVSAETTESGQHFPITNGQYVADGGAITFTANPTKGYKVEWYKESTYTNKYTSNYSENNRVTVGDNTLTISNINQATVVYAKFVEVTCRVNVFTSYNSLASVSINGESTSWSLATVDVGVHTTATVSVTPETNYYVDSLSLFYGAANITYGSSYSVTSSNTSATIRGTGEGTNASIYARINELEKIYFYNYNFDTKGDLWSTGHVYVYFNIYWGKYSSEYDGVVTHYCTQYAEMSPVWAGSRYYWAYVPRAFMLETGDNKTHVAFSDVDMHTYDVFSGNHGAYRSDYNRILNMFVPNHTESVYSNSTSYNSDGYWKKYNPSGGEGAGYYLQLHTGDDGKGNGTYSEQGEFKAVSNSVNSKLEFIMRVDNTSDQKQYRIISAGGISYYVSSDITNSNCTDVTVYEYENCTNCYFTVDLETEGDYLFTLDQSGEDMKLSVEFPIGAGDYRLHHTYTIDEVTHHAYSDVIKARDAGETKTNTVSMYLNKGGDETLKLEKCTGINGTTKKPEWNSGDATNLSGVISELESTGNGVYQFDVKIDKTNHRLAEAASNIGLYTGNYYIKSDCAYGRWTDYHSNLMGKNTETFDKEKSETFDYYYCRYASSGTNVKCVVANAYNNALCDTLVDDAVLGSGVQYLPAAANIRFSYNSYTNELKRTYMNGSSVAAEEYLLLQGDAKIANTSEVAFTDNKVTLVDHEDWIYIIDIKAKETARARLTANYNNGSLQYLIGSAPTKEPGDEGYDADWIASTEELLGGTTDNTDWNPIRIIYDFKTNHLISAWVATADIAVGADQTKAINADLMLIRENQGAAHQITFANDAAKLSEVKTVYGVLKLTKDHIQDYSLSSSQREFYWISFPFDVDLKQSFGGLGYYGTDWAMEYYDGKTRAKYGYWADSEVNWKIMWDNDTILHAYEGYVLALELGNFQSNYMWPNNSTEIFQYFPSKEPVSTIKMTTIDVEFPNQDKYYCNINRGTADGDRRVKDSYWHCIGVPGYADYEISVDEWNEETGKAIDYTPELSVPYVYNWRAATNDYEVVQTETFTFKPMTSYLVQFSKDAMTWTNVSATPASIVARRRAKAEIRECEFKLSLTANGKEQDRTFIRMSDEEGITAGFEFNYDLSKAMNPNKANIYTMIGYEPVAGNIMPLDLEQTTIIPVGVKIATAGDYTFAMPEGTSGVGVVLIDNITGTRTNLALEDYTVSLTADKIEDRFSLEISPIQHTPTGIENAGDGVQEGVRKVVVDGIMYIVRDGVIFDARGNRVK